MNKHFCDFICSLLDPDVSVRTSKRWKIEMVEKSCAVSPQGIEALIAFKMFWNYKFAKKHTSGKWNVSFLTGSSGFLLNVVFKAFINCVLRWSIKTLGSKKQLHPDWIRHQMLLSYEKTALNATRKTRLWLHNCAIFFIIKAYLTCLTQNRQIV